MTTMDGLKGCAGYVVAHCVRPGAAGGATRGPRNRTAHAPQAAWFARAIALHHNFTLTRRAVRISGASHARSFIGLVYAEDLEELMPCRMNDPRSSVPVSVEQPYQGEP
jgi:hypothetical protein